MGKHGFGQLHFLRGIIVYKLSSYEQKAFAGLVSDGLPNIVRRISSQVFRVTPRKLISILF